MAIRDVISRFGGIRQMAEKLDHRNHTTVQGWADRGVIPAQRQHEVLTKARELGIPLGPADLIAAPESTADAPVEEAA